MDNQKVDISVELSGSVEDVIYKNADNGYTVINLGCDEGLIAVVGNLGDVNEGERLSLRGGWITSPKYGRQFKAAMCERSMPETESEISAYLGSGVIKGLGPAIAKKIVKQFGTEALDIIDNDCMQLTVIKGITSDKALYISNEYHKITGVNEVIKFLGEYNFGPAHAISVWSAFEHDSIKQIKTNPYILCTSGIDIDFRSVDRMAADLGFDAENSDRVRAGIVYVLHENANAGHTCLPTEKLRESVCDNLGIERRQFESCLDDCEEKDWVVRITLGKREFVYLPEYYLAETYIAKKLAFMLRTSAQYEKDYSDEIRGVEFSENIQYEDLQRAAISACLTGSVFILTGGPGTGKTTTLNGVIKILKAQKKRILLCAPTGRAAKRMSDLTGEPARTIHRLLEVDFNAKGELKFKRNETNPLPADVVIADEMSMVDALLMCSLVRAIKPTSKFIMVGDSNQLPSILCVKDDDDCRPGLIRWLEEIRTEIFDSEDHVLNLVTIHAQGMVYGSQSSVFETGIDDTLSLNTIMFRHDYDGIAAVIDVAKSADNAVQALTQFIRNLQMSAGDKGKSAKVENRIEERIRESAYTELDRLCRDELAAFDKSKDFIKYSNDWKDKIHRRLLEMERDYLDQSSVPVFDEHEFDNKRKSHTSNMMKATRAQLSFQSKLNRELGSLKRESSVHSDKGASDYDVIHI